MKKVILYSAGLMCLVFTMSCKKDQVPTIQEPETSNQLLTKVIKTIYLGSEVSSEAVINYQYNEAGKIISEGDKTYVRDEMQRIVRIFNSNNCDGRPDTKVYYSDTD